MSIINTLRGERDALGAVDVDALRRLIEKSLNNRRSDSLRELRLGDCGAYVAAQLREFERALEGYSAAKAAKKLAPTESIARRAGMSLVDAVQQMKHRVEEEEKENQLLYIEDAISPPYDFSENLTVQVSYRWRQTTEDEWKHSSITFIHCVDLRPDYTIPQSKRKSSARSQKQSQQDELYRQWERLMQLALFSVRDFFKDGGKAADIPKTFHVRTDPHKGLNNFSADFWRVRP